MANFTKLLEEIKKQKQYAKDDLKDAVPQTVNSRLGRKQSARLRLETLFFDYKNEIKNKLMFIVVAGENANEFAKIAKASPADVDSLDGQGLYNDLTSMLDARLFKSGQSANYVLNVAARYLEDIALEIGVREYNQLIYKSKYQGHVKNLDQAKELISRAILEQIGPEFSGLYLVDQASKIAFNEDFDGKKFPILIKVSNLKSLQEVTKSLQSTGNTISIVSIGDLSIPNSINIDEVNEESVISALKQVTQTANKSQQ